MKRVLVMCLMLVPAIATAQLVPGKHNIVPLLGAMFPTADLLHATALHPVPRSDPMPLVADIRSDAGFMGGLRYSYNLTRRLQVEAEATAGVSGLLIQLLQLRPDQGDGEPQFETTTMDGRVYQYFFNLTHFLGPWGTVLNPFWSAGIGFHTLDIRQKGEVNTDPIRDRGFMAGLGLLFQANERLAVRVELRDFMYNFSFDNQFVDERAPEIIAPRNIGLTTAVAGPRFQNDMVLTIGFAVTPF